MTEAYSTLDAIAAIEAIPDDEDVPATYADDADDGASDAANAADDENSDAGESAAEDEGQDDPDLDDVEDEAEAEVEPETAIDPPHFLDPSERAAFVKLPKDAKAIVQRLGRDMQADYTRKTQHVAEQRKALEQSIEKIGMVELQVEADVKKWRAVDWKETARNYPADQVLLWQAEHRDAEIALQDLQQKRIAAEETKWREHTATESEALKSVAPEFLHPSNGQKLLKETLDFIQSSGVPWERARWATAAELAAWRDAKRYRDIVAKRGEKPVLKSRPDAKAADKPVKPGPRPGQFQPQGQARKAFNQTRSVDSAVRAILELDT